MVVVKFLFAMSCSYISVALLVATSVYVGAEVKREELLIVVFLENELPHVSQIALATRTKPVPVMPTPTTRATRSPAGARRSRVMAAVTTAITLRSITPATSRIAVRLAQLVPQCSPKRTPCLQAVRASAGKEGSRAGASRQAARWCAFHAVNWSMPAITTTTPAAIGTPRASDACRISILASATPKGKIATPHMLHTKKYPKLTRRVSLPMRALLVGRTAQRYRDNIGTRDGSIIATIMTIHIPRNDAVASGHVAPGVLIHTIDIVQPPGIVMPPIPDMDLHPEVVSAELATNSSADMPKNACSEVRSENMVVTSFLYLRQYGAASLLAILVVTLPPEARLVASFGCAIEPLIHSPDAIHSTRVGGIGVVDHAILKHECAHTGPLANVRRRVGSAHSGEHRSSIRCRAGQLRPFLATCTLWRLAPVVVLDPFLALVFLGE